jgi:hypothetical protein
MSDRRKFLCLSVESVCLLVSMSVDISACYHAYLSVCLSVEYFCLSSNFGCQVSCLSTIPLCRMFLHVKYLLYVYGILLSFEYFCIASFSICGVFLSVAYSFLPSIPLSRLCLSLEVPYVCQVCLSFEYSMPVCRLSSVDVFVSSIRM